MSFDIHQFLGTLVKGDLPKLAMHNAYYGAGLIAGAIEFLGNCIDQGDVDVDGRSARRFCMAINELFPAQYHPFSRPDPYDRTVKPTYDLYSSLRCGMAHVLRPQGVFLTGSIEEATNDGNTHLQILTRDGVSRPLIVVEQLVNDFKDAVDALETRLASSGVPAKLSGNILTVWDS